MRAAHDVLTVALMVPQAYSLDDPAVGTALSDAVREQCADGWWRPVNRPRLVRASAHTVIRDKAGELLSYADDRLLVFEVEVEPDD